MSSSSGPHDNLLNHRQDLTHRLATGPLDPTIILERARTYCELGYADLAVADAYVALTLVEDQDDEDFFPTCASNDGERRRWPAEGQHSLVSVVKAQALRTLVECLTNLGCLRDALAFWTKLKELPEDSNEDENISKLESGVQHLGDQSKPEIQHFYDEIAAKYRQLLPEIAESWDGKLEPLASQLPNFGLARREIYSWNEHEPERMSTDTLGLLNERLRDVAPDLEARASVLPDLAFTGWTNSSQGIGEIEGRKHDESLFDKRRDTTPGSSTQPTLLQLGLFAKRSLQPGTEILREKSVLSAVRANDASLCDSCAAPLPDLDSEHPPVACGDCENAIFCSIDCRDEAKGPQGYHSAPTPNEVCNDEDKDSEDSPAWPFCDNDGGLEDIGRDPNSSTPSDDLYFLLISRAIAMAEHRGCHPLDLEEVKYLWGEFESPSDFSSPIIHSLPFSLHHNVILPLRYFTTLLLSDSKYTPYSSHWLAKYDFWVIQTLCAKCRGVASARQGTWDGKPEVAAVHWRWCLANHSCAPGVEWAWGAGTQAQNSDGKVGTGEIVFRVRKKPVWQAPGAKPTGDPKDAASGVWEGISEGAEILSHYCDVDLPVAERRGWARGALGGDCRCERCLWESGEP